jgi:hypothetical protein
MARRQEMEIESMDMYSCFDGTPVKSKLPWDSTLARAGVLSSVVLSPSRRVALLVMRKPKATIPLTLL